MTWDGNVARGAGRISGDTGAFTDLPFSLPARIGRVEGKTSPEELLASAHAGCLGMGLASELANPDARVEVRTTIRMDEVDGKGHQIVASTVAKVVAGVKADYADSYPASLFKNLGKCRLLAAKIA